MADISKTVSIIFLGDDKASATIGGLESKLGGLGTSADDAKTKAGGLGDELEKVGDSEASVLRAVDALKAFAAAIVVKEFMDANLAYEQFIKTMTIATGSQEAAAEEFQYIRDVANRLGTEITSTADAYAKFASAAKGTAIEGEDARRIFEAFAGTMASTGASAADVSGAMTQLAQGVSKGKFELDDLKSIAERIPGFFGKFAESLGVSTEELYDMISAGQIGGDELLKFAADANKALESVNFDGFVAAQNRFKNALDDVYLQIGQTGAFDALTGAVKGGTIAIASLLNGFIALGEIAGVVAGAIATGNWRDLGGAISDAYQRAIDKTSQTFEAVLGVEKAAKSAGDAGKESGEKIAGGMDKGKLSAKDLASASKEVDAALKALGIDPKQFKDPLAEVLDAFNKLATNPAVTGEQFLSGLLVTLDKIKSGPDGLENVQEVVRGIAQAYQNGTINADQYTAAINAVNAKQSGLWEGMVRTTEAGNKNADALGKQADQARKAEEETRKYALELEKLASNERIALIEARVQLNVAELQEDTKRIEAAFTSLNTGIQSTGDLLGSLFGNYADASRSGSWAAEGAIRKQIDLENERRDQEFELQERLIEAQIESMRARTDALNRGDGLIQIDGAGLQPHLEAFMWEILKTIQTRVNEDGLEMLLGVG